MTAYTEDQLWQQFRAGDEQAFATLYTTYFPVLYGYGYHIAQDEELVKDCIQTLFIELWRSRRNLAETVAVKFYLLKAMRRHIYRAVRKQKPFLTTDTFPEPEFGGDLTFSPEFDLIVEETTTHQQGQLRQAISQLTNRQKEAITLVYIEELSYAEVAELMSLQVRTVYNLIHMALEQLRKLLNP